MKNSNLPVFVSRFISRQRLGRATALIAIVTAATAFSQDGIPYISPELPKDPNLQKVTMFRLWYVASGSAPSIALVREDKGRPPQFLEGKLEAGLYSPYVPLKPGDFTLHILDGTLPAPKEPTDKLPLEEKKLLEPFDASFKPGEYVTLLVEGKQGVLSARLLEDKRPSAGSPPVMAVKDFSGLGDWSIKLLNKDMKLIKQLWTSSAGLPTEPVRLPGEGIYRIQVSRIINGESWQLGLFEAQLSQGAPFSIILNPGGHGDHGSCGLSFDAAPGNYDAAHIKAVAEGSQ